MKRISLAGGVALFACLPGLLPVQAAPNEALKPAPQLTYRSAFADYKPYKDEPPADWRKVNEAVAPAKGGASGHAGHSMGGMKGMAPPPPAGAASGAAMKPETGLPMRDGKHPHGGQP
jgi:hypothetical protein